MTVDSAIIACLRNEAQGAEREVCGALIGDAATIRAVRPLPNHSTRPDRFYIPAAEVLRVEAEAAVARLQLLGFYHSHTSGSAVPSRNDLEAAVPGYIYLIVAADGGVRAWRLRDDRSAFDEIELAP